MRYAHLSLLLLLAFSLMPVNVFAADGVQFVDQSVFLSQPSAPAGSNILIYASIVNTSTSTAFNGMTIFKDGTAQLGQVGVALSPGEARVVSISWTPDAGNHDISALLVDVNGVPVNNGIASSTQAGATFIVEAPPPPPPPPPPQSPADLSPAGSGSEADNALSAAIVPATDIRNSIISMLPASASSTISSIVSGIDGLRQNAADALNAQIASTQQFQKAQSTATTTGAMSKSTASSSPDVITSNSATSAATGFLASAYLGLLSSLSFILQSAALSYLCLAALVFFALYFLYHARG